MSFWMAHCLCLSFILSAPAHSSDLPIGFVSHYPMIQHEDDSVPETGASVLIVRAPWALIEPTEGAFDFRMLDQQLEWAHVRGLKLVFVIEAGPAHAAGVPWLVEKLLGLKETQILENGTSNRDPSIFSPTYRLYLSRYIRAVVTYLQGHKLRDAVYGYDNGCEWWFPLFNSYGPLVEQAFQNSLEEKYEELSRLNDWWGTSFPDWASILPPKLSPLGIGYASQGCFLPASSNLDVGYATSEATRIPVKPGESLSLEARCEMPEGAGACRAEIAWLKDEDPALVKIDLSDPVVYQSPSETDAPVHQGSPLLRGGGEGEGEVAPGFLLQVTGTAPEGATKAWLHLKSIGPGRVVFTQVSCKGSSGLERAPNPGLDPGQGGWQFIPWTAGERSQLSNGWSEPGRMEISYQPSGLLESKAKFPLAEVGDWFEFRARSMTDFMDWFASEIKAADSGRPVISYLTFAFAGPFEWDYSQQMGISLDDVADRSPHVDVLGLQLASSAGDVDSVTGALDMARKSRKPLWAVDLLDFSKGVAIGETELTKLSLAVLQHGGTGIQYYCWWGTPVYNYSELGVPSLKRMISRIRQEAEDLKPTKADVALVMPRMPLYAALPEPANDWADFMGWSKVLAQIGICPDVYTLEELGDARLGGYRAVVVPDCAYLPSEGLKVLRKAERRGASVMSSGRFASRDLSGRTMDPDWRPATVFDGPVGRLVLGETFRHPSPTDTPRRLRCREQTIQSRDPEFERIRACFFELGLLDRGGRSAGG